MHSDLCKRVDADSVNVAKILPGELLRRENVRDQIINGRVL